MKKLELCLWIAAAFAWQKGCRYVFDNFVTIDGWYDLPEILAVLAGMSSLIGYGLLRHGSAEVE